MPIMTKFLSRIYVELAIKAYNAYRDIYSDVVLRTSHILVRGKDRSDVLRKIFSQCMVNSFHKLYRELTLHIEEMRNVEHDNIYAHIYILKEYFKFRKRYKALMKEVKDFDKEYCHYDK